MFPNLIVVGAQKSGTTSLCDFLDTHSDCLLASPKEPGYLSSAINLFDSGAYNNYFSDARNQNYKVLIDGTTEYLSSSIAPIHAKALFPDSTKVILVLRNPMKRAYSGYMHTMKKGFELRSPESVFLGYDFDGNVSDQEELRLARAIADKKIELHWYKRKYDNYLWVYRYLNNSFYSHQINRYLEVFGKDKVLVIVFEDLIKNFEKHKQKLASFLGIDANGFAEKLDKGNPTIVRQRGVGFALGRSIREITGRRSRLDAGHSEVIPEQIPLKPPEEVYQHLSDLFQDEIDICSDTLDLDLRSMGW